MSGANTADFIAYWEEEGAAYAHRGDYAWMAEQLTAGQGAKPLRVLEIGCGVGFGTQALIQAGHTVLAVDVLPGCLDVTRQRVTSDALQTLQLDLDALSPDAESAIRDFAPDAVVCWLMGAPQDMTGAVQGDAGQAVAAYRERLHRKLAELASGLSTTRYLHYIDRTVIPWQAKDLARDTLVRYHHGKTVLDLPWQAIRADAMYRKMAVPDGDLAQLRKSHPALKSATATLASIRLQRRQEGN